MSLFAFPALSKPTWPPTPLSILLSKNPQVVEIVEADEIDDDTSTYCPTRDGFPHLRTPTYQLSRAEGFYHAHLYHTPSAGSNWDGLKPRTFCMFRWRRYGGTSKIPETEANLCQPPLPRQYTTYGCRAWFWETYLIQFDNKHSGYGNGLPWSLLRSR